MCVLSGAVGTGRIGELLDDPQLITLVHLASGVTGPVGKGPKRPKAVVLRSNCSRLQCSAICKKVASRRAGRQPGAGPCAPVPAAQLVRAMLAHDHTDRRQLGDLVATKPAGRPTLPIITPPSATATRIRIMIDDLIHLILGLELTTRTPMPALPTSLAPLAFPAHQFPWPSRARARRCARVCGGSTDGGVELVRESRRACSSSRLS